MSRLFTWFICTLVALVAVALGVAGCGGGGAGASGTGTVKIYMADAPDPSISSVEVTIDRIDIHSSRGGWQTVMTTPRTVDLMTLIFDETLMGTNGMVPAGAYQQLRMVISDAWITDSDGRHQVTNLGSLDKTGIKFNFDFMVDGDSTIEILMDFNAEKSIVKNGKGNYQLQPVVPCSVQVTSGTVTGLVTDGTTPLGNATVTATAVPPATGGNSTLTVVGDVDGDTVDDTGKFKMWALKEGSYNFSITWTDPNNGSRTLAATANNVTVTAGKKTDLGTIVLLAFSN